MVEQSGQAFTIVGAASREGVAMRERRLDRALRVPAIKDVADLGKAHRHEARAEPLEHGNDRLDRRRDLGRRLRGDEVAIDADGHARDACVDVGEIVGNRGGGRGRVGRIGACDHPEQRGRVLGRPRHGADMIEGFGERKDAVPADPAPGRLDAGEAAAGRGKADRTAGIRAERRIGEARGDGDARAAGGVAGPVFVAERVHRLGDRGMIAGIDAFGGRQLAEHDGAGGAKPRRGRRLVRRLEVGIDRRAETGGNIGRVEHVLDRHRHAMQRPAPVPGSDFGIRLPGSRSRDLGRYGGIGMQPAIMFGDARQHQFGEFERGDAAGADRIGERREFRAPELWLHLIPPR